MVYRSLRDKIKRIVRKSQVIPLGYKLIRIGKASFLCPVCGYEGPFVDVTAPAGRRQHAACPSCGALERHRLQFSVMRRLSSTHDFSSMSCLHIAPEAFFSEIFCKWFKSYTTADLNHPSVDYHVDLTNIPFPDRAYDCVFASHVLEHIADDKKALSEIRRILKAGGLAILPLPFVCDVTVEYPQPNPHEYGHVRAVGFDYLDRLSEFFDSVEALSSSDVPEHYQPYIYEDRSIWPTEAVPLRRPMAGERHVDIVPICRVMD